MSVEYPERLDEALSYFEAHRDVALGFTEAGRQVVDCMAAATRAYRDLLASREPEWLPDELDQWWDSRSRAEQSAIIHGVADKLLGERVEPDEGQP